VDAAVFCNRISKTRSEKPELHAKTEIVFPPFDDSKIGFVRVSRSALTDD